MAAGKGQAVPARAPVVERWTTRPLMHTPLPTLLKAELPRERSPIRGSLVELARGPVEGRRQPVFGEATATPSSHPAVPL